MHKISIPQSVIERVIARRGREHVFDNLDPKRTALIVVDMQNAFMLPEVAHTLCPMAQEMMSISHVLQKCCPQSPSFARKSCSTNRAWTDWRTIV